MNLSYSRARLRLTTLLCLAVPASAQIASENFEAANTHLWGVEFTQPGMQDPMGGNPGGRLALTVASSSSSLPAAMIVPAAPNHPWSGNFRQQGASRFSFDREVLSGASNFGTILFLTLGSDNGTPTDFSDDSWAFTNTGDSFQFMPVPWGTVATDIPSASLTLPTSWDVAALPNSPNIGNSDDFIWDAIIRDVSYVGIAMGRPFNGGPWFGTHVMSFDNFELSAAGSVGTQYCGPAALNSVGLSGRLSALGSSTAAANNLTLVANGLPPNQFGIFVTSRTSGFNMGAGGTSNGNLCLAGVLGRFSQPGQILSSGAAGTFQLAPDLTMLPEGGNFITATAGETWNFQAWHRDGVGLGSNFTEGLAVQFN